MSVLKPGPGKAFDGLETLRRQNYETILDQIEKIRPLKGLRLLEIGSSKGWFLEAAQRRGAVVAGVEPVHSDAIIARAKGFKIEEGLFPISPIDEGPYDVIAFNDVFEHLPNPREAAGEVEHRLGPDGVLSINIPSSKGILFRTSRLLASLGYPEPYERMWQKGLPSPHMAYFSPQNLKDLIERHSSLRSWPSGAKSLPAISAVGLKERIESHAVGVPTWVVYIPLFLLSKVARLFPSDIHLAIFTKDKTL